MISMLYITFPDEQVALKLADALLDRKWIACYNLIPIKACYWWQGKIEHEGEVVAVAKTSATKVSEITTWLEENHPYETPCIIHWEVKANQKYVKWVNDSISI